MDSDRTETRGDGGEARIHIAYHDRRPVLTGPHLVPVQVGRARAGFALPGALGDDTGDTISDLNPEYCELTAHYWAWKNPVSDGPVGLMHYRRLFDFADRLNPAGHAERYLLDFDAASYGADVAARFAQGRQRARQGSGPLLIVARPSRLSLPLGLHYRVFHQGRDLAALRRVTADRHPDFLPDLDRALRGNRFVMGNMFVMSPPVLDHYSALLFDLLGALRSAGGAREGTGYQRRYLGFLAERIMTAYVLGDHRRRAFPDLVPEFRGIVNIDAEIPRRAGRARLARLWLQRRITPADAWRVLRHR